MKLATTVAHTGMDVKIFTHGTPVAWDERKQFALIDWLKLIQSDEIGLAHSFLSLCVQV